MEKKEWFADWFDSPYYPILYQHRDFAEAEAFIMHLVKALDPPSSATFLDLACGRGRHSRFLNQMGYHVTGLDLSPESIADAKEWESPTLRFGVHDMRQPFPGTYSHILNLFTSFGYFSDFSENIAVLRNIAKALLPGGIFVMDFFNSPVVIRNLVAEEHKTLQGIDFEIRKEAKDGFIVKSIRIVDGDKTFDFQERVQALEMEQLVSVAEAQGLHFTHAWGNYQGEEYVENASSRMILFFRT